MESSFRLLYSIAGLALLVSLTAADYRLVMQVFSFENPTGKCESCRLNGSAPAGCCDNFTSLSGCTVGGLQCDTFFYFCLRPLATPSNATRDYCPLGSFFTLQALVDADIGNFVTGNVSFLGLPNPLTLQEKAGRWEGVQLLLVPIDLDFGNPNDLIDEFILDLNINPQDNQSEQSTYQGDFGFLTLHAAINIACLNDYYGRNCETFCVGRDDDEGHYNCSSSDGSIVCKDGYQDPQTNCTRCTPLEGCSPIGGFCNSPNSCVCRVGYFGSSCEEDLDPCGHTEPCRNGGVCSNDAGVEGGYICDCAGTGFEGANCDQAAPSGSTGSMAGGVAVAIAGGVAGALLAAVVMVIITATVIVCCVIRQRRSRKHEIAGEGNHPPATIRPLDNPNYRVDPTTPTYHEGMPLQGFLHRPPTTGAPVNGYIEATGSSDTPERLFNNPIYSPVHAELEGELVTGTANSSGAYSFPRPLAGVADQHIYEPTKVTGNSMHTDSMDSHAYMSIGRQDPPSEYHRSLSSGKHRYAFMREREPVGSWTPPQYASIGRADPPSDYLVPELRTKQSPGYVNYPCTPTVTCSNNSVSDKSTHTDPEC